MARKSATAKSSPKVRPGDIIRIPLGRDGSAFCLVSHVGRGRVDRVIACWFLAVSAAAKSGKSAALRELARGRNRRVPYFTGDERVASGRWKVVHSFETFDPQRWRIPAFRGGIIPGFDRRAQVFEMSQVEVYGVVRSRWVSAAKARRIPQLMSYGPVAFVHKLRLVARRQQRLRRKSAIAFQPRKRAGA